MESCLCGLGHRLSGPTSWHYSSTSKGRVHDTCRHVECQLPIPTTPSKKRKRSDEGGLRFQSTNIIGLVLRRLSNPILRLLIEAL